MSFSLPSSTVFENKEKIVLVMEFASRGELYDYADMNDIVEGEVQRLFRQIVSAVAFCHMVINMLVICKQVKYRY